MASKCSACGKPLGFIEGRIFARILCNQCAAQKAAREQAQKEQEKRLVQIAKEKYSAIPKQLWTGEIGREEAASLLRTWATEAKLTDGEQRLICDSAFHDFTLQLLADDVLTQDEENKLSTIAPILGVTQERIEKDFRDLLFRLTIGRMNDGRMPILNKASLLLKKGEVGHIEMVAALLKQVAIREYQGSYSGFSFRIVKGVRYHVGGTKGRSVVVGTEWQTQDQGTLSVTSHRVVFLGSKRSVEMPYKRLLQVEVFSDGIRLHLANRVSTPTFVVENGDVVACAINTAIQRFSE
ncbi:MAG: hypothetical protein Q7T26_03565 [Dehalococcoidia bacterium]|nr:hypothetical protein [Dehalococcoidia bacterium]